MSSGLLRRGGAEPPVVARHIVAAGEVTDEESLDVLSQVLDSPKKRIAAGVVSVLILAGMVGLILSTL